MRKRISVSRQYAPLRVCADLCLYFYTVSLFSFRVLYSFSDDAGVHAAVSNLVSERTLPLFLLVAACFALGLVIVRLDSAALRFLLSLLPGLCFLLIPFRPEVLILIAAWLYYVIVMTVGNFDVHLDVYRRRSVVTLSAALLLTLCLIIFHFGTDDWYRTRLFGGETFGLLFFLLCVLSLRGMRRSFGSSGLSRFLDAACVVALPVLPVAVFFLLRSAVPAVTFLFSLLSRFLIWLYRLFFPQDRMPELFHPPEEQDVNKTIKEKNPMLLPVGNDHSPDAEMMEGKPFQLSLSPQIGLYITLALLAAALIFVAVMLLRGKKAHAEKAAAFQEDVHRTPYEGLLRRTLRESAVPANVRQIRRIYRSYLKLVHSLRIGISPSDTSEDVLGLSSGCLDIPENAALRELYIAARYGDPKAVTARQVSEAKRCLGVIEAAKRRL